jgi:hypothetical protein
MRRLFRLLAAAAAVLVVGVGGAGGSARAPARATDGGILAGLTGDTASFSSQTGQKTLVHQAFLAWGQGQSSGASFTHLLDLFGPIPMLHLATTIGKDHEVITPAAIAAGRGDGYFIALNNALAAFGKGAYIRPMGEMNNANNVWAAFNSNGSPRDANHSTANYRKAFERIYLIVHGGSAASINARLRALGMPPLKGGDLPPNPFPRVRVVWSPLASSNPRVAGNAPSDYYPGSAFVDVEGGSIYAESGGDNAPWAGLESLYRGAVSRGKTFAIPEWGLYDVDDPSFVRHMCSFLSSHPRIELAAFYEGTRNSIFDLRSKPAARAAYRGCLPRFTAKPPSWSSPVGPRLIALSLKPKPPTGPSPLVVSFQVVAKLSQPIVQWQLAFGDGKLGSGSGPPPGTIPHEYPKDGTYQPTLFVYTAPPFDPTATPFVADAEVTVGEGEPVAQILPNVEKGPAPLSVSFRIEVGSAPRIAKWELDFGDGSPIRGGNGPPPHFSGHTYPADGIYRVLLVLGVPGGSEIVASTQVQAGGAAGGGGQTGGPAPPVTGKTRGTVVVNGHPFTVGKVPYNSVVDVTKGVLTIQAGPSTLQVYGSGGVSAKFKLLHSTDKGKPIVELRLVGGDFSVCKKRKTSGVSATPPPKKPVRRLFGKGKGHFRTRGSFAAATVRGTYWVTEDLCGATRITVKQGIVEVLDLVKKKTVSVHAGHSYVAAKK